MLSVSVAGALSHADTPEIFRHSPTRVLLPALESMESKRHKLSMLFNECLHTKSLRYSTSITGKDYKLKLYSLHRRRERYIISYIWKITQHMVPNINGTMGHKIKTRKHPRHGTHSVIQYIQHIETQYNSFKKCNNSIFASFVQFDAKISERHRKY